MLMLNMPGLNLSRKIAYTPYAVMNFLCASTQILGWNLKGLARYFSDNTADFYDKVLSLTLEGVSGGHDIFFL